MTPCQADIDDTHNQHLTGDFEGFEVHRRHLKQLVALRGGLDHLGYGGGTKTVLLQCVYPEHILFEREQD